MSKDDMCYGLEHQERLDSDWYDTLETMLDDACDKAGEDFDTIADRITWPVRIFEFRRIKPAWNVKSWSDSVLTDLLDSLDEEHADPDGDPTEPTESMKLMADAFVRSVLSQYVSWACEPTGNVIEVTRDMARTLTAKTEGEPR